MAKAKLTPEQWAEARREWECNPAASYATVAAKFMISKALVGQRAISERWQRDIGVPDPKSADAVAARAESLQDRPSAGHMDGRLDEHASQNSGQVGDIYRACKPQPIPDRPRASLKPAATGPDRPLFANGVDELAWIEEQVSIREKAILERHAVELRALTNSIYDAARKTGKAEMGAASRAANQLSQALERKQKMEREHCAMQTRIELGAHYGAGPRPAVIVIHQHPDGKLV